MFVDNSFAKNNVERKEKIYINFVAIVVGAVNMWNSPDSPENTGVQTPFEWLKGCVKLSGTGWITFELSTALKWSKMWEKLSTGFQPLFHAKLWKKPTVG